MTSVGYDRHTLCANRRQKRTNQGQLEMKYSVDQNIRHLTWTLKRCFGLFRMSWGVFTKSVALPKWIKNRFGFCSVQSKKLSRAILEMSNWGYIHEQSRVLWDCGKFKKHGMMSRCLIIWFSIMEGKVEKCACHRRKKVEVCFLAHGLESTTVQQKSIYTVYCQKLPPATASVQEQKY